MNVFDGVLVIITLGCGLVGLFKGLTRTVFSLGSVAAALWLAPRFSEPVGRFLERYWNSEEGTQVLGFVISFLVVAAAVVLAGKLLSALVRKLELGWVDRLAGVLLGVFVGLLAGGMLVYLVGVGIDPGSSFWKDSRMKGYFVSAFQATIRAIPSEFEKRWQEKKERIEKELRELRSRGVEVSAIRRA